MKICVFFTVTILIFLSLLKVVAQPCTTLGQTPSTAFPVCGGSVFSQSNVPSCGGTSIPVPACSASGNIFDDRNPFFYKFTCFTTGTLGFTITPNQASDDFDWQIFDVTGKSPNAIYTDPTCFVSCSWSGTPGVTGATAAGTVPNGCDGTSQPKIVQMPTITKGNNYILFISNFSASNQGYNLEFSGGTAVITDSTPPNIANITNNCLGDKIFVKLNKKMRCNSLASNASDISITNNPTINSIVGFGCSTGFDTDSIIVSLASPLPAGAYVVAIQNGSDGNTILDNCNVGIPIASSKTLNIVGAFIPTPMDSIMPFGCNPSVIDLVFKRGLLCSSVALDGSDFSMTGISPIFINSATIICTNGLTTTIRINFVAPIGVTGNYRITLKTGTDGNTILNECGVPTPIGSKIDFLVYNRPSPNFTFTSKESCKVDSLFFTHTVNSGVNKWDWIFDGNPISSNIQNPIVAYTSFLTRQVKLKVSNPICSDSVTTTLPIINHDIIAQIIVPDTTCPVSGTQFIDGTSGLVNTWKWTFGNGQTSSLQNPPLQYYTIYDTNVSYISKLVVTNTVGCKDSSTKSYVVKPSVRALVDGILPLKCSPNKITIFFNALMRCNTVAINGSDFLITGPSIIAIDSAKAICSSSQGRQVEIFFRDSIKVGGTYTLLLKTGTDGNTIINDCGLETLSSILKFRVFAKANAGYINVVKSGCKYDTLQFFHNGFNDIDKWRWYVNDSLLSDKQNTSIIYNSNSNKLIRLNVANALCGDSISQTITLVFDSLKAKFSITPLICPAENAIIKDTSIGNISSWQWKLGNGIDVNTQIVLPQSFPFLNSIQTYPNSLIVGNLKGCFDTVVQFIKVVPNCLIDVATAFTPNGDGLNDYLYPINAYKAEKLLFRVFNRFGQLIFETKDFTRRWDGRFNNTTQPSGTYVWTLEYTDKDTGKNFTSKGFSVLIR